MKATPQLDFLPINPDQRSLPRFASMLQKVHQTLTGVINGRIGYGDGTKSDNIDGAWVSGTFTLANTDTTFTHNLGRIPVGWHVMSKSQACDIFKGTAAWTKTTITLQGTVAGTAVSLFVV